jgi:hypothetical protein
MECLGTVRECSEGFASSLTGKCLLPSTVTGERQKQLLKMDATLMILLGKKREGGGEVLTTVNFSPSLSFCSV